MRHLLFVHCFASCPDQPRSFRRRLGLGFEVDSKKVEVEKVDSCLRGLPRIMSPHGGLPAQPYLRHPVQVHSLAISFEQVRAHPADFLQTTKLLLGGGVDRLFGQASWVQSVFGDSIGPRGCLSSNAVCAPCSSSFRPSVMKGSQEPPPNPPPFAPTRAVGEGQSRRECEGEMMMCGEMCGFADSCCAMLEASG